MSIINVTVEDLPESDTIPAGEYALRIDEVGEVKQDKNGGDFIQVEYSVTEGEYTNRKVFDNYIPLAGKSTLRKLLKAIKYKEQVLADTDELIGEELRALIGIEEGINGPMNKVTMYLAPTKQKGKR